MMTMGLGSDYAHRFLYILFWTLLHHLPSPKLLSVLQHQKTADVTQDIIQYFLLYMSEKFTLTWSSLDTRNKDDMDCFKFLWKVEPQAHAMSTIRTAMWVQIQTQEFATSGLYLYKHSLFLPSDLFKSFISKGLTD